MSNISHEQLLALLDYCQETGELTWRKGSRRPPGQRAGTVFKRTGYRRVCVAGKFYSAHRLAWFHVHGQWPAESVDHINGDKLDNRLVNLRAVSQSLNMQNCRRAPKNSRTGVLGVQVRKGRFIARITLDGRRVHIGSFDTAEQAQAAYADRKRECHPGFTALEPTRRAAA